MQSVIFLHSDVSDPYAAYEIMRSNNPVYWDSQMQLWAVCNYRDCVAVLTNPHASIAAINANNKDGLNECALQVEEQLARLSNGTAHQLYRQAAMVLAGNMHPLAVPIIAEKLFCAGETDWVAAVCKKMPAMALLHSFNFKEIDIDFITDAAAHLVKIMLPQKSTVQVQSINAATTAVYKMVEHHLLHTARFYSSITTFAQQYKIEKDTALGLFVSNLIGLVIQGYDAGRGILSNALLQLLSNNFPGAGKVSAAFIKKSITETLRFDPPVHHTRRVASAGIVLNDHTIQPGDNILLVLAAANRDPQQFDQPAVYSIDRVNNSSHLTFGMGGHMCVAKHFAVDLAAVTLTCLFERFSSIKLLQSDMQYEPLANVRLPKSLMISIS
ncbi:MAG: cytochrome P450 [Chitinophagaceae bacterium]